MDNKSKNKETQESDLKNNPEVKNDFNEINKIKEEKEEEINNELKINNKKEENNDESLEQKENGDENSNKVFEDNNHNEIDVGDNKEKKDNTQIEDEKNLQETNKKKSNKKKKKKGKSKSNNMERKDNIEIQSKIKNEELEKEKILIKDDIKEDIELKNDEKNNDQIKDDDNKDNVEEIKLIEKEVFQNEKITNEQKEESGNINNIEKNIEEEKEENINYNYIYFQIIPKKEETFQIILSDIDSKKGIIEKIKVINYNNKKIELYSIKIATYYIPENHQIEISFNENNSEIINENNKFIIPLSPDINELYTYIPILDKESEMFSELLLIEQFMAYKIYVTENKEKINIDENFIKSTLYFLKKNNYFGLYVLSLYEFHKSEYIENFIKLWPESKFQIDSLDIENEEINKINDLSNNPNEINIKDESNKNELLNIFYEIILYFHLNYQIDKINEILEKANKIYSQKFISSIPSFPDKIKNISKGNIIKLLSYGNNFEEIKNILKISEKDIISILKIINEKSNEIHPLFNKEKNEKIKLIDFIEINKDEDLNSLYDEFENLINNKSLEFIDISDVIKKYINFNNKKIESLLLLKKIINKADEKINISMDINEKIHELILTLDVDSRIKYFKNDDFYFKEKYKSKRALEILDGFDLDKLIELNEKLKKEEETNLEKIFDIEELYNKIKGISNNIKDIEKLENFFVEINEEQKNIMKNILENNLSNSKITLTNEDINIIIKFYNTYNYSLEEKLIIKLLDNTNNFNQMNKILGIIDKNDIISFFKIIIHKIIIKIFIVCKKEKNKAKKLKLDDYVKLKSDDDINQFFNEVNNNKKSLDCFEISSKVFKEYIRINQDNNIDFFLNLEKLFKLFCKDANLENEINEIIDNRIKGLNIEEKVNYFLGNEININEENKYKKKRALNMLDGLDIDSLINLNNKLKKEKKINIEQIFSSQKNELYTKIISAIKNIKDIKSIYFSELIKEENQNLNKYLVIKFEELLKEISDENNHIKDISDLIIYCINKKLDLENKLIEILKKDNNKNIYKEVIIQLINTEESSMIKKCFNYLEDNNILFLNIINQQKDIIKKYIKKEGTKIEFKNSFNPKNNNQTLDELIIQLNLLINNSLISSMSFKPKNFELIINDKIILEYVIQNINKENHLVEWDEMIKENINDLIKKGDLKNIELLKLINLENNINKKKEYLTIDVFDGIKTQYLNENEYN